MPATLLNLITYCKPSSCLRKTTWLFSRTCTYILTSGQVRGNSYIRSVQIEEGNKITSSSPPLAQPVPPGKRALPSRQGSRELPSPHLNPQQAVRYCKGAAGLRLM